MLEDIKNILSKSPKDSCLYLLRKLNQYSGFFSSNGEVLYFIKNIETLSCSSIDTDYLSLITDVKIIAVENYPQFHSGKYNMIKYKGDVQDSNLDAFLRLCIVHSKNLDSCEFYNFFYSLINLFQLPKEQQFKNMLGLYGELKFIEYVYRNFNEDISIRWHQSEYDKYDFSYENTNFEVKSIMSEEAKVLIKHDQIFNGDNNYITIVRLYNDNNGETLDELVERLRSQKPFIDNLKFQLCLERERKRISLHDAKAKKLKLDYIKTYDVNSLTTIVNIPENIENLVYKFNFDEVKEVLLTLGLFI